ncbi:hypothetical protein [Polycyclovorans algicola]|uniref:hypothetical protein n=1 Tax=Polycyclovorans algicola TaxID=616992 RepID=UPI001377E455|nr:hypothetical protein [Polycyclovorans algicola]
MRLPGTTRYGRYCPSQWLMHLANWGLSLAGAPVAFTATHRVAGCPLRRLVETDASCVA